LGLTTKQFACSVDPWEDEAMAPDVVEALLKLPSNERADLALALWDSLNEPDREASVDLTPEVAAELDRRLAEHQADPSTAIPWEEVRKKFSGGR
jgi:putative addiction module component (TIGR02574 family)